MSPDEKLPLFIDGAKLYATASTSAASLASSSRTIGMRPIILVTASNSERDASGKSNAPSWEALAGSASQRATSALARSPASDVAGAAMISSASGCISRSHAGLGHVAAGALYCDGERGHVVSDFRVRGPHPRRPLEPSIHVLEQELLEPLTKRDQRGVRCCHRYSSDRDDIQNEHWKDEGGYPSPATIPVLVAVQVLV